MYKFFFDPIDKEKEDIQELIWHNLELSDKYYKQDFFMGATMGWFSQNSSKNYHDLEKELRIHELNTHLCATEITSEKDVYKCTFICRAKHLALMEVLESSTYEENLEKLKKTEILYLNDTLDENITKLKECSVKLRVETLSSEDILDDISIRIRDIYQEDPDVTVFGKSDEGFPMFCFTLKDKLVSDVGFIVRESSQGPSYEIIQLEQINNVS